MTDELAIQDELRGLIIATLLRTGVRRVDLSSSDFSAAFEAEYHDFETFDDLFHDMMKWLQDEGYIRYGDVFGGDEGAVFGECQPTSKAISLLDVTVPGDKPETVREISSKAGASPDGYTKLGAFFGGIIGGTINSVG